jgi:uncharacterized protein (TIGR02001 family)
MKKIAWITAIGVIAGTVAAQSDVTLQMSDVSVGADVGLYSAYVWRGQIVNNNPVVQPSVTATKGPFSLNVWGNWNVNDNRSRNDSAEIDYTFAYTLPESVFTEAVTMDVGVIAYTFPGSGNQVKPTEEVFAAATFNEILFTPVASVYYDVDQVNGWYGNLALSQGVEISDAMTAEIGASVGYGTRNYNKAYFGEDNGSGAINDYNVYASTDYALTENLSLGALLQYTRLDNGVGSDVGQNDVLWGGLSLAYKFL